MHHIYNDMDAFVLRRAVTELTFVARGDLLLLAFGVGLVVLLPLEFLLPAILLLLRTWLACGLLFFLHFPVFLGFVVVACWRFLL